MIRPFSNGTQWLDWEASNCDRCTKLDKCELRDALNVAYYGDGSVPTEIGARLAYTADKYIWQCGEVEWTEEWKSEFLARQRR